MINNKKGDEKILSLWMVVVWTFICLAIVLSVYLFYEGRIDIREIHADILAARISECLSNNEKFQNSILSSEFDIYTICNLKKEEFSAGGLFYTNIKFNDYDSNEKIRDEINIGNKDLKTQCELKSDQAPGSSYFLSSCSLKKISVIYTKNNIKKRVLITINSASNNIGGRLQ